MKIRSILLALLLLAAAVASAQTTQVEIGYRWLDLKGNDAMYRSQLNERDGLILRAFTMTGVDQTGLVEQYRIDATNLGAGPFSTFRVDASRSDKYHFRLGYRSADVFSALPGFANPLLGQGALIGQHTFDRDRTILDADLELIPGRKFSPFVGYSYNRFNGPGATTYFIGQDEFRLGSDLRETDHELRAGTSFNIGKFTGQVTQGWREFRGKETLSLFSGAGAGNNPGPILGQPISVDSISRTSHTDVSTPFTNAWVVGQVTNKVRVIGNFARFAADSDGVESESLTGSLVSFQINRFYSGLNENITSRAKNTTWRGEARTEIALMDGLDLQAGYRKEHREVDGSALIDSLFLQSITFGGFDKRDLTEVVNAVNAMKRDEQVISASLAARSLGPFSLRTTLSATDQDVTLSPDLSEIVLDLNQSGSYNRRIRTLDTVGSYSKSGLLLTASWKTDRANDPIFRTDFTDRDRFRFRASWGTPNGLLRLGGMAEQTDQNNNDSGIGFDGTIRQYTGDVQVNPLEKLRLRGSISKYKADSTIGYRIPESFDIANSVYAEDGKGYDGGFSLLLTPVTIDFDGGKFKNEGLAPFQINRYRARIVYDFMAKAGVAAEWAQDKYSETLLSFGDYQASRYGVYFRWHP